jgi:hypothetical protein
MCISKLDSRRLALDIAFGVLWYGGSDSHVSIRICLDSAVMELHTTGYCKTFRLKTILYTTVQ